MTKKEAIKIFEEKKVRTVWDDETEEWFFSIVDVVSILTESVDGRKYWNKLKQRLKAEGSELVTNCHQLKLPSTDGKYYKTDVATTEQLSGLSNPSRPLKQNLSSYGWPKWQKSDWMKCKTPS